MHGSRIDEPDAAYDADLRAMHLYRPSSVSPKTASCGRVYWLLLVRRPDHRGGRRCGRHVGGRRHRSDIRRVLHGCWRLNSDMPSGQSSRGRSIREYRNGISPLSAAPELDFIEKLAVSAAGLDAKDGFLLEDLSGSFESEPEWSEVSEGAPASPHAGPVEQFTAGTASAAFCCMGRSVCSRRGTRARQYRRTRQRW